jgi:hypothetical protein
MAYSSSMNPDERRVSFCVWDIIRPSQAIATHFVSKEMGRTKRTITLSETVTQIYVRMSSSQTRRGWCADCESEVVWVELPATIQAAAGSAKEFGFHLYNGTPCRRVPLTREQEDKE